MLLPVGAFADDATEAGLRFTAGRTLLEDALLARQRGMRESAQRLTQSALGEFLTSNRLSPNVNAAFNIAYCLEELGRENEAYIAYQEYLGLAKELEDLRIGREALRKLSARVARVLVETTPPGATLYVDRENLGSYGQSPRTLAIPGGLRRVIAVLEDYETTSGTVALTKGDEARLGLRLKRKRGTLRIESDPTGAEVRDEADAAVLCTTPCIATMEVGAHLLTLSRSGHRATRMDAVVRADRTERVNATLLDAPAPKGRIRVLANLDNALVEIDAAEAGFSPLVTELTTGLHSVRVAKPGFQPWTGGVEISASALSAVDVTLEPDVPPAGRGPLPWILLGLGATSASVGAGFGIRAMVLKGEFEGAPVRGTYDASVDSARAADVLLGAAGVAVISAGIAYLFDEPKVARASNAEVRSVPRPYLGPSPSP